MRVRFICLAAALAALAACAELPPGSSPSAMPAPAAGAAGEESRHEGYYYPRVSSQEVYKARARTLDDSDKQRRLGFIAILLAQQLELPYPPQHILFGKGDEAEKMIVIGFGDSFVTLYRARAVMAALTVLARDTPLFHEFQVDDLFTFYDLAKLLGFKEIVLSDGRLYAHRVTLE
jgi:hypothetical protein